MIPISTVMIIGLAGCSGNNRAGVNTESQNLARPLGYYSNEGHPSHGNRFMIDNDGPLTELMDHQLGDEGRIEKEQKRRYLQTRDENGNPPNPTKPLAKNDKNFILRDNRFSTSDFNYHGHMNRRYGNGGVVTESSFQDQVTNKIRNRVQRVENVRSVRSVGYGNTIIVSVKLKDDSRANETKREIRNAVKPYADGRGITVYTDDGALGRDRNFNNHIQLSPNRGPKIH
jgi:spore cortex protein